ncbi:hypothetical protein BXZ70DRAFT_885183, partial [Cristinia sonorae]
LIVGDYFKAKSDALEYSEQAADMISWLRSRTIILALLRQIQNSIGTTPLTILRAVLTRWTSHLRAYQRLLAVRSSLVAMVSTEEARPATGRLILVGDGKARAESMFEIIKDNVFWQSLARYVEHNRHPQVVHHLEPLGKAANVIQAANCRLDTVLLMLGYLYATFSNMNEDGDRVGVSAVKESLEKRWSKADYEVFIAAVILNPLYQLAPFSPQFMSNADARGLLSRVYKHVYKTTEVPTEFLLQVGDYLQKRGDFRGLPEACKLETVKAELEVCIPNSCISMLAAHINLVDCRGETPALSAFLTICVTGQLIAYYLHWHDVFCPSLQTQHLASDSSAHLVKS